MKGHIRGRIALGELGLLSAMLLAGAMGGCENTPFMNTDAPRTENITDKYYGGDSAVDSTAARKHAEEIGGFGYPTVPSVQ